MTKENTLNDPITALTM